MPFSFICAVLYEKYKKSTIKIVIFLNKLFLLLLSQLFVSEEVTYYIQN